jgi:hypothetical protein
MARLSSQDIVAGLVQRGVPQHVAEGVVMNFQDESGLNTGVQEQAPTSGRGGFGLAQWTGPRRVALEQYAQARGKPIDDPNVQLDFFMQENAGPEAAAWKQVLAAPDRNAAAVTFVNAWERPAAEHAAARSASYSGKGGEDAPSEGGGRFGGTGLDATSTKESAFGAPAAAPGAASPYSLPKTDKTDKYGQVAESLAKGLGAFGGSGSAGQALGAGGRAPLLPAAAPGPTPAQPIVSGGSNDPNYQATMMALMQRLNTGRIWG